MQDVLDAADETVVLDIVSVTNGTENGTQQETITITDDDDPPTVNLSINPSSIAEAGGVSTVTATLNAVSGQDVTVALSYIQDLLIKIGILTNLMINLVLKLQIIL